MILINPVRKELAGDKVSFEYVEARCPEDGVCLSAMPEGEIVSTCEHYHGYARPCMVEGCRHPKMEEEDGS